MARKIKTAESWSDLPSDVRAAASQGLRDPEESGAPRTVQEALDQYNTGRGVAASVASVAIERQKEISVFCGDCLTEVPYGSSCPHISVGKRGRRTRIG